MRRRDFVASLSVAVAWPLAARAQAADDRVHGDGHVRMLDPMDGVDTAKRVTSAIPIVFAVAPSPLSLIASLARPGGNVTGASNPTLPTSASTFCARLCRVYAPT